MKEYYSLNIKKKIEFISMMLEKYSGGFISFEGDLSNLDKKKYKKIEQIPNEILGKI